jgi:hypothetical protein
MMNNVQGDCKHGSLGFPSGEDLTLATGRLVKLNADGHAVLPSAAADITPYVVTCGADQGYLCGVFPLSSLSNSRVVLKGTCQTGALLVTVGDGRVETGTLGGTALPVGVAEEDGVEGQHVLLRPVTVGARGATGATGPQGSAGALGATGAQGPSGVAGASGAAGAQGPAGAVGPQGPAGAVGAAGADGATGPAGAGGAAGAEGPQGPQGETGMDGGAFHVPVSLIANAPVGDDLIGLILAVFAGPTFDAWPSNGNAIAWVVVSGLAVIDGVTYAVCWKLWQANPPDNTQVIVPVSVIAPGDLTTEVKPVQIPETNYCRLSRDATALMMGSAWLKVVNVSGIKLLGFTYYNV